jgi:hypothetical protein
MAKLNGFKVKIETGDSGTSGPVLFNINNHTVPFEKIEGGTGPGEMFQGEFEVNSFAHTLTLVGPEQGNWNIRRITVDYDCENSKPYSITFGEVTLNETNQVNIWQDPPLPVYDV